MPGVTVFIVKVGPLTAPYVTVPELRASWRKAKTRGVSRNPASVPSMDPGDGRTIETLSRPAATPSTTDSVPTLERAWRA